MEIALYAFAAGHLVALVLHRGHVVVFARHAAATLAVCAAFAAIGNETLHDEARALPRDAGPGWEELELVLDRKRADMVHLSTGHHGQAVWVHVHNEVPGSAYA
jgi:hypothetical protein